MTLPCSPMGCPMDAILRLLMGPWTTYILWVLRTNGPTRFGELKRRVNGISAKVLTQRLRMLEEAEVIRRHYEPTIPPQVTYALAPRGVELTEVLDRLDAIARAWHAEDAGKLDRPAEPETEAVA
ncbi:MAG TPA: helix-turn-helix domain-containing protein [Alphaproteobacteria bacterium]